MALIICAAFYQIKIYEFYKVNSREKYDEKVSASSGLWLSSAVAVNLFSTRARLPSGATGSSTDYLCLE